MRMVTVERMPQTVDYAGKRYGPSETPIQIPEVLANSLGLKAADKEATQAEALGSPAQQQAQDNLDTLLGLLAPEAKEGEQPDDVLRRLVRERGTLEREVANLTDRNSRGAAANREQNVQLGELSRQRAELTQQVEALTKERDQLQDLAKRASDAVLARGDFLRVPRPTDEHPEGQDLAQAVAQGFDDLKAELDEAKARPALPPEDEAIKRIASVNRISEAQAKEAWAALIKPAEASTSEG
ncbi:hypothetical protein Dcar01_02384 [Deinococcus carri]|uniref:Uncharacterized protein n=1 Tax=Deinococcus carri TaxID=1211323 RepID=A0ABP9WA54_9DEIO